MYKLAFFCQIKHIFKSIYWVVTWGGLQVDDLLFLSRSTEIHDLMHIFWKNDHRLPVRGLWGCTERINSK